MIIVVSFVVAAFVSCALTPVVRAFALRAGVVDEPDARKVHTRAVPRLGGVAVVIAWIVAVAIAASAGLVQESPLVVVAVLVVFSIGLRDDVRAIGAAPKLLAIAAAAALAVAGGVHIERITLWRHTYELGWLALPVTLAWIAGVTSAFNLIDGLDGLATGLAIIAATSCSALLLVRGDQAHAVLLVALVGAGVGFLPYNFNPATIFLGDSGSFVFGFVLAVTAIAGWQKGATAIAVGAPLLLFALPLADVTGSVARRLLRRQPVFAADQRHIHHWLLRRGLTHRESVLVLYACALALAALAVLTADLR